MEMEKDHPNWLFSSRSSQILAVIGFMFVLQKLGSIYDILLWFIRVYSAAIYRPYKHIHKYGKWAAITGCTSGIGLGMAKELAKRGMNLVLISRNIHKLQSLATEIQKEFNVEVKILTNDALNRQDTNKLASQLAQLDIGILVNNVGLNYTENLDCFAQLSRENILDLINVNVGNSVILMKHVLPNMIKSRKGCVINVCSAGSYFPLPIQQLYSSTKVYLDVLTKSIGKELISSGITMQSICPAIVQSNMTLTTSDVIHNFFCVSAKTYAKSVVNILGTTHRVSGYWFFDLLISCYYLLMYETWFIYFIYYGTIFVKTYLK